jgi:hypothetical protein
MKMKRMSLLVLLMLMCVGLAEAGTVLVNSAFELQPAITGVNQLKNMQASDGWSSTKTAAGNVGYSRVTDKAAIGSMPGLLTSNQALQILQGADTGTVRTQQRSNSWPTTQPPGQISGKYYWVATEVYSVSFNACELAAQGGTSSIHNEITVQVNQNARPANPVRELLWTTTIDLDGTHPGGNVGDWTAAQTFNLTIHASDFLCPVGGWLELQFVSGGDAGVASQYLDNVYMEVIPEPATLLLLGIGGLLTRTLRKRQ